MLTQVITFRDYPSTPILEALIKERIEKLDRFYSRIQGCRVMVEFIQKHQQQGKLVNVKIDVTVPGKELYTNKSDENVYVAARKAFKAIERQLEDHSKKRQGKVKSHNHIMHGVVRRLLKNEGYGFIQGIDGNEYYFSLTNVSYPEFEQLAIGDTVEYTSETLNEGRQAQHVIKLKSRSPLPIAV